MDDSAQRVPGEPTRPDYRPIVSASSIATVIARRLIGATASSAKEVIRAATAPVSDVKPIDGMLVASIEAVPGNESATVARLTESYCAAKRYQEGLTGAYAPGAYWKVLIEKEWSEFNRAIRDQDTEFVKRFLRNFFPNQGLSGYWGDTNMFEEFKRLDGASSVARADLMRRQIEAWQGAVPSASLSELDAPLIGNPWGYVVEGNLLYEPVCEYHYQASYFSKILPCNPVIVEIGGGFGGLAFQILRRMPGAKYIGFDLPESALLQSYYLSCAFPDARILLYEEGINSIDIDDFDIAILPNYLLPLIANQVADLVVNVRSLAEMPLETIREYMRQIDRIGRVFFFHENIYKSRQDNLHGIPSSEFPRLENFVDIAVSDSRWPRYGPGSAYPCREHLSIRADRIASIRG